MSEVDLLEDLSRRFPLPEGGGICWRCLQTFPSIPEAGGLCHVCGRIAAEGSALLAGREETVRAELRKAGLGARELAAEMARIPEAIRRRLPAGATRAMLRGVQPEAGFGLAGTPGIGKTMALAALIAEHGRVRLDRIAAAGEFRRARGWLAWAPWKAVTERIRALSTQDGGHEKADRLIEEYCRAEILVIDDLGAERLRGSYAEDWATSQLDRIVDERDREMRPLWYTTNLGGAALLERYGSRLWSRLCELAPLVELAAGADLRVRRNSP